MDKNIFVLSNSDISTDFKDFIESDLSYYGFYLEDENQYTRFIKMIENIVRKTIEYKLWAEYAKHKDPNLNCPICGADYSYITKETHHYPLTLFEIVENYLQEILDQDLLHMENVNTLDIAGQIILQHLADKVGYINLCKACHEKYHNHDPEVLKKVKDIYYQNKKEKNVKHNK